MGTIPRDGIIIVRCLRLLFFWSTCLNCWNGSTTKAWVLQSNSSASIRSRKLKLARRIRVQDTSSSKEQSADLQQHPSSLASSSKEGEEETEFDRDTHLDILDKSLKQVTNGKIQGILQYMFSDEDDSSWNDKHRWDDVHMSSRFGLMSHGSTNGMDGPEHNYVNFGACAAFQVSSSVLLDMPACRVAKPGSDQLAWSDCILDLRAASSQDDGGDGYIYNYQGFRCSLLDQRPFYIRDGLVWNCYDENGDYYGQAILFDRENVSWMD